MDLWNKLDYLSKQSDLALIDKKRINLMMWLAKIIRYSIICIQYNH